MSNLRSRLERFFGSSSESKDEAEDGALSKRLSRESREGRIAPENVDPARGLPEGRWLQRGVYLAETRHHMEEPHGAISLGKLGESGSALTSWGGGSDPVFFDLETTGLAGGTGTYAFLAGVGHLEEGAFVVRQLFLASPAFEGGWLDALEELLSYGNSLVSYNGRSFDVPLLLTRLALARRASSLGELPHLDLLRLSRGVWRGDLDSYRLAEVEKSVLHFRRGKEDVPGHLVPELYGAYLRSGSAEMLRGVFLHNRWDILSLAALQSVLGCIVSGVGSEAKDLLRAGRLWARAGEEEKALRLWRRAEEDPVQRSEALCCLAEAASRRKEWHVAAELWQASLPGENASFVPLVELSKIWEHRLRDMDRALFFAEEAMRLLLAQRAYFSRTLWERRRMELRKRLERLQRRVARQRRDQ